MCNLPILQKNSQRDSNRKFYFVSGVQSSGGQMMDAEEGKTLEAVQSDKTCSLEYFCEVCEHYPLHPVHGHYECPKCFYKTKCCEGSPQGE